MIDHGDGYYTGFGHLSAYNVSEGQTVSRGERIATSGNTGISTGPHLHYEVYIGGTDNSYRVDPLQYTTHPTLYPLYWYKYTWGILQYLEASILKNGMLYESAVFWTRMLSTSSVKII